MAVDDRIETAEELSESKFSIPMPIIPRPELAMGPAERLSKYAEELRRGGSVPPVRVRDFLWWFSAQRRGSTVVWWIRKHLSGAGLVTNPDFQSAYIDSVISFELAPEATPGIEEAPSEMEEPGKTEAAVDDTAVSARAYSDPTYRVSKLAAANNPPISVKPDSPLQEAVTIMLMKDFSQLPVMTSEREVKGVISWASIGANRALGEDPCFVREAMEAHQELRAEASLFQAIPIIVEHQYVLIRASDNRITGILTASDLSAQFQQLAEPFLLLGEVENHLRRILSGKFPASELATVRDPGDSEREVTDVADLTFGEYVRLLEDPSRWQRTGLAVDRAVFVRDLDNVRRIRNDVMHFDPDGIPENDLTALRLFARFLGRLN